jgi:hypothetical protein
MSEMSAVPHLIFVLAGQSNMAGRGQLSLAHPANPSVLALSGEDGQVICCGSDAAWEG